jgi:exodeoxyribonuclease VII large subunit
MSFPLPIPGDALTPGPSLISVGELNRHARRILEQSFPLAWISGEISNLTQAASGHVYFSLKDSEAQVRCVMFRNRFQQLEWIPVSGTQVEVHALVTLYEARGEFQLNIETMRQAGQGALYEAFARLKRKLEAEGLFDAGRKKPIPAYPKQIGIVTSLAAAALRDVLTTLRRRHAGIPVVIYPSPVQGECAGTQLANAVATADRRAECDVLILCRGGGAIEDLWAFNDEGLARVIARCRIPVISGVGHETDFTIADFVADARAPTPTAAAALAAPDRTELLTSVDRHRRNLVANARRQISARAQRVDHAALRLQHPGAHVSEQQRMLSQLRRRMAHALPLQLKTAELRAGNLRRALSRAAPRLKVLAAETGRASVRLMKAMLGSVHARDAALKQLASSLQHLDPKAVLARGYSLVRGAGGSLVTDGTRLRPGEQVSITLARGWAEAEITRTGD